MCEREQEGDEKEGVGIDKKRVGGIPPDQICASGGVNESSDYS